MGFSSPLTNKLIYKLLNYTYSKVNSGFNQFDSTYQVVSDLRETTISDEELIKKIIGLHRKHSLKVGFISSMPGILFLPISIPANVLSLLFVQMRMTCCIALASGYNLDDERVKEIVFLCIAGNSASSVVNGVGNSMSTYFLNKTGQSLGAKATRVVVQKGVQKGLSKVIKKRKIFVPLASGIVGSFYDLLSTNQVAMTAKETFFRNN